VTFVKDRPGHDRRYAIDASKLRASSAGARENRSTSGMRKTVRWYLDNARGLRA
jgi:dTDP-glucose 4,6-dehydratase